VVGKDVPAGMVWLRNGKLMPKPPVRRRMREAS
jgi:hypothetical protein